GFGQRPQHLLGSLGLCTFALGGLGLVYLGITWVLRLWLPDQYLPLHERALLFYALGALLLGAQMMSIGFLAELITAYQGRDEDSYSISEQIGRGPWTGPRDPPPATTQSPALPPAHALPPVPPASR